MGWGVTLLWRAEPPEPLLETGAHPRHPTPSRLTPPVTAGSAPSPQSRPRPHPRPPPSRAPSRAPLVSPRQASRPAALAAGSLTAGVADGMAAIGFTPPDRKQLAALTSSVAGRVTAGVSAAASKLQ